MAGIMAAMDKANEGAPMLMFGAEAGAVFAQFEKVSRSLVVSFPRPFTSYPPHLRPSAPPPLRYSSPPIRTLF